jgi:hypothetical protein
MRPRSLLRSVLAVVVLSLWPAAPAIGQDGLPSWNEGRAKQAILDFVRRVTVKGIAEYVPPAERIATFDNDGTLLGCSSYRSGTLAAPRPNFLLWRF